MTKMPGQPPEFYAYSKLSKVILRELTVSSDPWNKTGESILR